MATSSGDQVLVRLPEMKMVLDELDELLKTSKYIVRKSRSNLTDSVQKIITARSEENGKRRNRIIKKVEQAISNADVFAAGNTHTLRFVNGDETYFERTVEVQ